MRGAGFSQKGGAGRDWTQGSLLGNLWSISWPMLISNTVSAMGPTIDMIWLGRLGSSAIAGVGVSGIVIMVINSLIMGLFTGTSALIARSIGARDESTANRVAQQAFVIGIAFSFFMAIIGLFLAESILNLLGVEPSVVSDGAAYMRIQMVGMITMSALQIANYIMQASGDTRTPMKINLGFRIVQIILCPALVFGWWIFPRLGVSGASLSNVIAQGAGGCIALWIIFSGRSRLKVTFKDFHFDRNLIWRTIRIGVPASINFMERSFADLVLMIFIVPFGTVAVAAQSLGQRIEQYIQWTSAGIGSGAGILAAQNLGAGKPERAVRTAWLAVAVASTISLVFSLVIWLWVEPILRIFTSDPQLIEVAGTFLKIQIVAFLVWGMVVSISMVLNGIGDTLVPMLTNLITMWGVQMSLAYFLPKITGLEVYGIRWAIAAGIVVRAIIYPLYFRTGRWKRKKV
jgi:putative MATE family efflux protein